MCALAKQVYTVKTSHSLNESIISIILHFSTTRSNQPIHFNPFNFSSFRLFVCKIIKLKYLWVRNGQVYSPDNLEVGSNLLETVLLREGPGGQCVEDIQSSVVHQTEVKPILGVQQLNTRYGYRNRFSKGIVSVISSDPSCKDGYTTVPLKAWSDQV